MTQPPYRPTPLLARLLSPPGPAQDQLLTDGDDAVYAVAGRYCVTYLILGPSRVAVVDCGSAEDVGLIRRALKWLGRTSEQVSFSMFRCWPASTSRGASVHMAQSFVGKVLSS